MSSTKTYINLNNSVKTLTPGNFSHFSGSQNFKDVYTKDPIFHYLGKTCIEKPKFTNIKFDQDSKTLVKEIRENNIKPIVNENNKLYFSSSFNKGLLSSNSNITLNCQQELQSSNIRNQWVNESYPRILPQWIKYDKQVLKFNAYFNEHINESNVENYRIRSCFIYFYLEDETVQVFEIKTENSGIPQGTIAYRQKIKKNETEYLGYSDFQIGEEVSIFGKRFRICDCDEFTKKYFSEKGIKLKEPETVPEYVNPSNEMLKKIDTRENLKNIADYKEFCEINLGGGHPNKGLKNFLKNDRKVLSFDIVWDDIHHDKEMKHYKMNYYLADNMVEVREIKESNSGKGNFPYLLKKSILPKKPHFTYCPGLNIRDEEIYRPEDLILGNYVYIFNRPCFIYDCDDFTKAWYKEQ